MTNVPYFLEPRVRQALARAHAIARSKGLSQAFDAELFAADRAVQDLLGPIKTAEEARSTGAGTPEGARLARLVFTRVEVLLAQLEAARDRGPQGADAPVGRVGRCAPGRR